jgi:hypothetical protein
LVENKESVQPGREHPGSRQRVTAVREALIRLHKALLESERASYERVFGKVGSSYQFLQLVTTDPWFAWLRPVTQLIVTMDEVLEATAPLTATEADVLVGRAKTLLVPTLDGEGFSRHYDDALQRDPDVVFAHATAARLFRTEDWKRIFLTE